MRTGFGSVVLALGVSLGIADRSSLAQSQTEKPATERLDLRVTSRTAAGEILVDRGSSDALAVGDVVFLFPRDGGMYQGTITSVSERAATVDLLGVDLEIAPGTRGEVVLPAARRPPAPATPPAPPQPTVPEIEHPPWENQDEEWVETAPLLTRMRPRDPAQRQRRVSGHLIVWGGATFTTESERHDSFLRTGLGLAIENPFGRGGELEFDGEISMARTAVPDTGGDSRTLFRADRVSYRHGGTRFDPNGWEVGRFLQHGIPEFGVLDGFEWTRRRANGHRYGGAIGFMPEPDEEFETGEDFQVSSYYEWVSGSQEQLTVAGGAQKTLHNGAQDRDLFLAKARYLPLERGRWSYAGTLWIDYYDSGDDARGPGFDVTQAILSASKRSTRGDGLDVTYRHITFPEIDRDAFTPVLATQLADDRLDRFAVSGWRKTKSGNRIHSEVGVWDDEDESGADGEIGYDMRDVFVDRSRSDMTVFATRGRFAFVVGGRLSFGRSTERGRWDLFYEIANHHQDGFSESLDDLIQHRFRASRDVHYANGWSYSLYAEARPWDEEGSLTVGGYLQRSF